MITVIQRTKEASVSIGNTVKGKIDHGLLLLLGIETSDTVEDVQWLIKKIVQLRIFNDQNDVMNLNVAETGGGILVISQFTLHASTKKGNRPSYLKAARPEIAIPLYNQFLSVLRETFPGKVASGEFGADMQVSLLNDGPVTIIIDSKEKK